MTRSTAASTPQTSPPDNAVEQFARTPNILIACDYDGTLAQIVDNPDEAYPVDEAMVALRDLSELKKTSVAIISGRALSDLSDLTSMRETVHLVGSHGSEFDPSFTDSLSDEQRALLKKVTNELESIADEEGDDLRLEYKPASVVLHYRQVEPDRVPGILERVHDGPAARSGIHVKEGKKVIELSVVNTDKGEAIESLRRRVGANAVLYIGDDVTDEDAFASLSGSDLSIKVGDGDTVARHRVSGPDEVARLLARLSELRADWLCGGHAVRIERHSMLSDERTIAIVDPDASIVWMCTPRIDSPALFAQLLGGQSAGGFHIRPADGGDAIAQRYEPSSMLLTTQFPSFSVTDFLDCSGGRTRQRAGRSDLIRMVRGSGRIRIEFTPRLDFGRSVTRLKLREGGIQIEDSREPIVLYAPAVDWSLSEQGQHQTAIAEVDLTDEPLVLQLRIGIGSLRAPLSEAQSYAEGTTAYWRDWAASLKLPETARDAVLRSALTIRALVHGPSGAIAAAATTSLPECLGGVRNWDYRYCWPRDASMAAASLVRLGSVSEAMHLLDWLLGVIERATAPEQMHPIYTVFGEELAAEGEIGELNGYAGSCPVRVSNAAAHQVQLDVFGPITDLVYELALKDAPLTPHHWRIVEAMVSAVQNAWHHPDHGIWEIRSRPAHQIHSKVMCWMTIDRAIKVSNLLRDDAPPAWHDLRDQIASDVLDRGWNASVNAFGCAYGNSDADAASLSVGLSGLLAPDDPRFLGTLEYIENHLREGNGVYRYLYDDSLPGQEGTFHLCTAWLIQSYILVGRTSEARELFDAYVGMAGPTGLMSEEHDTRSGTALGNFPQAYSHIGLIDCAIMLDRH